MNKKIRILVFSLLVAAFPLLAVVSYNKDKTVRTVPGIGAAAPDFTLNDPEGRQTQLSKVLAKNKATVLNFWATWCPPCRREIPEFIKFYSEYRPKKVELLAVNLGEQKSKVAAFITEAGINFPVLLDADGKVGDLYRISSIPTTFILDGKGKIRDMIIGQTSKAVLKSKIDKILAGK